MATVSAPNIVHNTDTSISLSPPIKGLKKVLSGRRRSSEVPNDHDTRIRRSVDSLNLDRSSTTPSARSSPSRDGNSITRHSGVQKFLPGHSKRQRQKMREAELKMIDQEPVLRGRSPGSTPPSSVLAPTSDTIQSNRSTSSLLTDGSENDTPPPLVSRNSHTGYFTASSPLIASKLVDDGRDHTSNKPELPATASTEAFPMIVEPEREAGNVSPKSMKLDLDSAPVLSSPVLFDKADTLRVDDRKERRSSISKLRGKSPARKIRDVFTRSSKSPRSSPERDRPQSTGMINLESYDHATVAERRLGGSPSRLPPEPLKTSSTARKSSLPSSSSKSLVLETDVPTPKTPPSGRLATPLTTVTPPTPTDLRLDRTTTPSKLENDSTSVEDSNAESATSVSSNIASHRRVKSASSTTHPKSKLSMSITAPLTPTVEEKNKTPVEKPGGTRNITAGSGFFSSWVSAAQNAATTITSLTAQNRGRAGTASSEPAKAKAVDEKELKPADSSQAKVTEKQPAIETLGSGNLDFSHFGLDAAGDDRKSMLNRSSLPSLQKQTDLERDEAQAKVEDMLAKRAVSAAYQSVGESTPVAELSDPLANVKHAQSFEIKPSGTLTPPNGSILEHDGQSVKRSNSVRSKLANRRSRGSSIATGQSSMVTMPGTSLAANSLSARLMGFTPAPKQRNRTYHQQFRSVPEDDNLIEDYSCALQKEILLAGRIYISEGHICFSSNILGWVTTLIISFEEIVSIERENTAMIIPNAIAIQTLHARHTFRSLLSREATFDLMIGIWKVNHPASFSKSVNGKQIMAEQAQRDAEKATEAKAPDDDSVSSSDDDSDSEGDDDEAGSEPSFIDSNASIGGSDGLDTSSVVHKPSGSNDLPPITGVVPAGTAGDVAASAAVVAGLPGATIDFPGPVTHAPTECTDSSTHYEKVIKDEIIAAPLGKIYSLMYGPQSGVFLRQYLVDGCKSLDLALEDDKKGLTNENKSRQYSYIKPLAGPIGPKQTKCVTIETLDFFDLEKSVSVTCTTQTPDVPSGSAFATKTRYCMSWAPGNRTRLQMNCTIEWSAKSWLKGPIEKGANEGQQQYGDGLVKALKAAVGRSRGGTVGSKEPRVKKKRKSEKRAKKDRTEPGLQQSKNWGIFEPLRPPLEPVFDIVRPAVKMELVVGILSVMMIIMWFGGGASAGTRQLRHAETSGGRMDRLVAYELLWQREENDLWDWLEDRAGVDRVLLDRMSGDASASAGKQDQRKIRTRVLKDKTLAAKLHNEKWSQKQMQEAVRVTRERLDDMQRMLAQQAV